MRANPVRARLLAGGTAYGLMAFEFFTPGLMAVLAAAGAEFVVLDMEHSGIGIDTIRQQVAASRGLDIVPIVRVPGCHYHLIAGVLDAGAMGIMVPMVETAEQAAQIAAWCRYRPAGVRGLAFGIAHDDFTEGDVIRKMAEASEKVLASSGVKGSDLALLIPHQANKRIIMSTAERLGLGPENVVINIDRFGNTTAGTIPLAMQTAIEEGRLKKGDLILLASVGAGFTVGACLLRWEF